jgi:hypothetical protein
VERRPRSALPRAPLFLGLATLVPFAACSATSALSDDPIVAGWAFTALAVWTACVLAATGSVHWGAALRDGGPLRAYVIGGLVPVLPFLALSFGGPWGLMAMAAGFVALLAYEQSSAAAYLPTWYPRLRLWLTGAILVCLLVPIYVLSRDG